MLLRPLTIAECYSSLTQIVATKFQLAKSSPLRHSGSSRKPLPLLWPLPLPFSTLVLRRGVLDGVCCPRPSSSQHWSVAVMEGRVEASSSLGPWIEQFHRSCRNRRCDCAHLPSNQAATSSSTAQLGPHPNARGGSPFSRVHAWARVVRTSLARACVSCTCEGPRRRNVTRTLRWWGPLTPPPPSSYMKQPIYF
jgi:hypothetical protein